MSPKAQPLAPDFVAIRRLLVPYAKHYTVTTDTDDMYCLDEDLPHSRTMFGFVHPSKGGARLGFYPLHVFPELLADLPKTLASKVKLKSVLSFRGITAAELRQLAALFAAGHRCIQAKRKLVPDRGYYRPIDLDRTTALVTKLATRADVTVTRRKADVVVTLGSKTKVPAALTPRLKKPGTLVFKTITLAEHDALASLLR